MRKIPNFKLLVICVILLIVTLFALNVVNNVKGVYVDPGLIPYGQMTLGELDPVLRVTKDGAGHCTAFVIDDNYAITAAHCVDNNRMKRGLEKDARFAVTIDGETFELEAVAMNGRIDVGLFRGDFRKFDKLLVDFYSYDQTAYFTAPLTSFISCGYPYSQKTLTCTRFYPKTNVGFYIAGQGMLIPGMSGGPVLDPLTGAVIGVNSAAGQGAFYVSPVLGMLGAFKIEPKE